MADYSTEYTVVPPSHLTPAPSLEGEDDDDVPTRPCGDTLVARQVVEIDPFLGPRGVLR